MRPVTKATPAIEVRSVTDEECAFFHEHGWVKLPGLVSADGAEQLRAECERLMAADDATTRFATQASQFKPLRSPSKSSELFSALSYSRELGRNAARLMTNPLFGPRQALWNYDMVLAKQPAGSEESAGETRWHQDHVYFPLDRDGSVMFWIALVPIAPEMGSMRFVDGSHRLGHFGRFQHVPDGDTLARYPGIAEHCPITSALDFNPGDATVHDNCTIHSAGANLTDRVRLACVQQFSPADALYTGSPYGLFDSLGLTINEPIDHPNFPNTGQG
jgi:hypothetical protein